MTGGDGRDHLVASAVADPASPAGGALGLDLRLTATKPPALHNRIGWIDFAEGGSSYYYSRTAMSATRVDHRRRADRSGHRRGLVRPPVGRLHRGRWRRLGLVRRQPRRRDGPDALARPGRGRLVPPGLRDARRRATDARRTCRGRPSRSRRAAAGRARPRAPTTRLAGGSGSRPRDWRSTSRRRSRTRSSTPARRQASCTGRAPSTWPRRGTGRGWAARPTWSSPAMRRRHPRRHEPVADRRRQGRGEASGSVTPLAVATATICASTAERPARSRIIALADCLYAVAFVTDWTSASTAVSWIPL